MPRGGKTRGQGRPLGLMMLWVTAPQRMRDLFPQLCDAATAADVHNSRDFKRKLSLPDFRAHRVRARQYLFEKPPELRALDFERHRSD